MTNTDALTAKIKERGVPVSVIARRCDMSRESFYNKLKNETEFKASEIMAIAKELRLTNEERDEIFFCLDG